MPKINFEDIQNNQSHISQRNLSYRRIDNIGQDVHDINHISSFIKNGGVILSKLPSNFDQLDYSFINDLNPVSYTHLTLPTSR